MRLPHRAPAILATGFLASTLVVGCSAAPEPSAAPQPAQQQEEDEPQPSQAEQPTEPLTPIAEGENREHLEDLLSDLISAYETPSDETAQAVDADLAAIQAVSQADASLAQAITDNWREVFSNPSYELVLYAGGGEAPELAQLDLPDDAAHAFVVPGYELVNGAMSQELKDRCEAAAAAARSFPQAIIVCSGGATGQNNPEGHTEAGMMRNYLVETCGIDESRIHVDETAQDTTENARNTFRILHEQGVGTMTIVTSTYHQRWVQAVYNAQAALDVREGKPGVAIVGNYCVAYDATEIVPGTEDRVAIEQISDLLELPHDEMQARIWYR